MKAQKVLASCLSLILLAAVGCAAPEEEKLASFGSNSAVVSSLPPASLVSFSSLASAAASSEQSPGTGVSQSVGKWAEKAPMSTPRFAFGAETVDGKIFAIGGENQNGFLSSAEAYEIQSNAWHAVKSMAVPRSDVRTVVLGGKIYALGGYRTGPEGPVCTESAERYDPAADRWETLKPMGEGRVYHEVVLCKGKIYVIGGSQDGTVLSSVEAYNPKTETWTKETPMSSARMHFGVETVGGKIYVFGGSGPLSALNSVEMFDPAKKRWIPKASMKTPRFSFQTETVNGKVYVIGGLDNEGNLLSSVEEYDPSLDQWTKKSALHTPKSWFRTAVVNGKIYVVGGLKGFTFRTEDFISSTEKYDPDSDRWSVCAQIPSTRSMFQAVAADGGIYVIGGELSEKVGISSVEEYTVSNR